MANKIGIKLALDGEKEFTNGMKSAQQSAKLFDQQLKNLEEEYKGNANSIEALTKKQELLEQKQRAYNNELKSAKDGQKNATKNYQEATKQLDKYQEELEQAKKALKDMEKAGDTSSKAYKDQAKAVEQLEKAVQKQSDEQARASTNITKWDTAVAKAEGDVKKANAAVEQNAKYVDEASKSADGCAKSIDKMGKEASETAGEVSGMRDKLMSAVANKAVSMAGDAMRELGQKAIEAAKYVIDVGSQFEASMSKVEALSGASADEIDRMSQKAQELGSSTKFSASEVADGFSYMALAGWDAQQSIAAIDGIVNLAAASEMDLAEASDMVTDYLSAFGMEASEAGHMADMMAYAQANSNTSTRQLGEAFGNCAANMNAAGQDMETTTSFLEAFANQGVKGSEAGTKLAAIMRDITAKMKDGKIQIGDTAVAVTDANGNFRDLTDIMVDVEAATDGMGTAERSAALAATFTSRSVGGLNMILAEGMDSISGYEDKLRSCDGTASNMAGTMQNNLQGAITEMNSAAEGLGIALYNKVNGPLTDAVRLATDLISGITDVITPEKDALTSFIEEIEQSNKAVEESIEHARATIEGGEAKAAEITAYQGEISNILTACEEFNAITLEDGKTAIVNASGEIVTSFTAIDEQANSTDEILSQFASDGLNTEAISSSSSEAQEIIGYVEDKVESVETRLSSFASEGIDTSKVTEGKNAIVELFSEAGEKVGEVEAAISDTGKIEMDTGNIEAGTQVVITGFDDSSQSVQTFKGSIEDLSAVGFDFSGMTEQFSQVEDAVTRTYHITDEFTKVKIDTMVNSLGDAVSGLAQAWDSSTGSLTANKEELEDWFDTAKQVAMYNALQDAISEMYSAWGTSAVNVAKAQSALKAAQDDLTEANEKNSKSLDYLNGGFGEYYDEVLAAELAVQDAEKALKKANETYQESDEELRQNADALQELKGVLDESAVAEDGVKESVDAATNSLEEFDETEENAAQAAYEAQKEIAQTHQDAASEIVDAYDSAKQAAENAFSVNPFDEWGQNAEDGMAKMQASLDSQLEGMTKYADNLQTVSEHVGNEITPDFLQYITDMGVGGAQVMQELADAFESGDTSAVEDLMQRYTQAMQKQDEISSALAMDAVAFKLGIKEFASTPEDWKGLDEALTYVQQFGAGVSEETLAAFQRVEAQAQAMGVAIPEGLASGIESGTSDPEAAVQAATEQIRAAIQGRSEGLLQAARDAGINIPPGIAEGIEQGGDACVSAYANLISTIASSSSTGEAEAASQEAGGQITAGVSEGISSGQDEVETAAQAVVEAAGSSAAAAKGAMSNAGLDVGSAFAKGIQFMQTAADSAGQALADGASTSANNQAAFDTAGQFDGAAFANGIRAQNSSASYAGQSLAESGKSGASGVGGWDSVGSNMAEGVASGIRSRASSIAQEAAQMVRDAINAAKAEAQIASPSKKTRDQIGKQLGAGVAKGINLSTKTVTAQATLQMNQALKYTQDWLKKNKKKLEKKGGDMSAFIASGWQTSAKKLSAKNFGIASYTVDTKGNKSTKETETYYSEIFSAAQKYLNNIETVYNVSAKQEKTYWTNVRKNLKRGTQAWYDATNQIKQANAKIKQDRKKAADEAEKAEKAASAKILDDAKKHVEATEMTTKVELNYWQSILKQLKAGSDEYATVAGKIQELKKDIGSISVADDLLDTYQTYFNMGEKALMQYWDAVREQYTLGTEERVKADKQYLAAYEAYQKKKKELDDDLDAIEKDRISDIAELQKSEAERIAEIEARARKQKLEAEKRLAKSISDVNKKLASDIEAAQKKAVEDRTKSLVSAFSLFDEFESKSATGQQLLFNMQSQAAGYKDWQETINAIRSRGILSQDIISQLLEAGPQQSAAVHALNSLSDNELRDYQKAYDEKMLIASQQAADDAHLLAGTTDEIARLQKDANDRIAELKTEYSESMAELDADTAEEIADLKKETQDSIAKRNADAERQTAELKASQASERLLLDQDINADFLALAKNIKQTASDEVTRLINALTNSNGIKAGATTSGTSQVQATVTKTPAATAPKAAAAPAPAAAPAKTDSTAAKRAAVNAQVEAELKTAIKTVISTGTKRSKSLTAAEKKNHAALWEHIVSKYGYAPNNEIYRNIAAILGVKVSNTPTSTQKNNILKALKKHNLASGTRHLDDVFAWMDEQGIGSEMIVRRADNARLNTNVQRGDAIIPAVNTDNLWEWSKIVPKDLVRVASEASMNARVMNTSDSMKRDTGAMAGMMEEMFMLMQKYMPYIAQQKSISVDGRELARATSEFTGSYLAMSSRRRRS